MQPVNMRYLAGNNLRFKRGLALKKRACWCIVGQLLAKVAEALWGMVKACRARSPGVCRNLEAAALAFVLS